MIFILSSDADESTNMVIKWLLRHQLKVVRLGSNCWVDSISIANDHTLFDVKFTLNDGSVFHLSEISSFWYRKSKLFLYRHVELDFAESDLFLYREDYKKYLFKDELSALEDFIIKSLEEVPYVGNYKAENGNKLWYFRIAKSIGFLIPNFQLIDSKKLLIQLVNSEEQIIKPIQDLFYLIRDDCLVKNYYSVGVNDKLLKNSGERFFPTMVQQYLPKKFEIRSFYLEGEIFSMAIFSQLDDQTKVDFRNYNISKPNRMVPFKLPSNIEIKICLLMKKIGLNTGSLDLILTPENKYVFLEINPAGQYGMIESACFYGLDQKIAEKLKTKKI